MRKVQELTDWRAVGGLLRRSVRWVQGQSCMTSHSDYSGSGPVTRSRTATSSSAAATYEAAITPNATG